MYAGPTMLNVELQGSALAVLRAMHAAQTFHIADGPSVDKLAAVIVKVRISEELAWLNREAIDSETPPS